MKGIQDRVATVTGASAGIGRACAVALAGEGARLVLTARREGRLQELSDQVRAAGGSAVIVIGDAREEETARRLRYQEQLAASRRRARVAVLVAVVVVLLAVIALVASRA